jgi:superfamily II DNA or RNA helicase
MEYLVHDRKKGSTLLSPHQLVLQNYISTNTLNDNILIYHALGTGKTLSAIAIAEGFKEYVYNLNRKIIVIVKNKTIANNFSKELFKIHRDKSPYEIKQLVQKYYSFKTFGKLTNQLQQTPNLDFSNTVIIIDEAHNLTTNEGYNTIRKILDNSYNTRLVMLTATPIKNDISEFFQLANLLEKTVPIDDPDMTLSVNTNTKLSGTKLFSLSEKGTLLLQKKLVGKISYLAPNLETFPREYIESNELSKNFWESNMSSYQLGLYKQQLTDKSDTLYKSSISCAFMVYPNNTFGPEGYDTIIKNDKLLPEHKNVLDYNQDLQKYSCKLHTLVKLLQNSTGKVFVYTNIVTKGGTSLIRHLLEANGYTQFSGKSQQKSFIIFDSNVSDSQRKLYLDSFNNKSNTDGNQIRIIVGSQVLAEGITLKAIRHVHILDASWNMTSINQIIGRAIRNFSHSELPFRERNVKTYKHIAVNTQSNVLSIDKEKYILSTEKDKINTKVYRLLKRIAFDCNIHKKRNTLDPKFNGTSKCDYQVCNYTCDNKAIDSTKRKKFIYDISFVLADDIALLHKMIPNMFKKSPIWNSDDFYDHIISNTKNITPESIDFVISQYISKQMTVNDIHNRPGFIVGYGPYYILNPKDKNIWDSFFSKTLDYSIVSHQNTIENFIGTYGIQPTQPTPTKKSQPETSQLPQHVQKINETIKKTFRLYGSYYVKGTNIKDKFKIIDVRNFVQSDDTRKEITGKACTSFKRPQLEEIAQELKITFKDKLAIKDLCKSIEQAMNDQKRVLE